MNDFDPSLDEIVSAYVDGVATPDERALVEADPALLERVETFRRLHGALAAPPPTADDAVRQRLIAHALADTATSSATVHAFRSRRSATLGPIVAAAAVIAMFFGVGTWLVASQDNNDADEATATAAGAPSLAEDLFNADSQGGAATTRPAAGDTGQSAPTAEAAKSAPLYLGTFADEANLRLALVRARDGSFGVTPTTLVTRATASSSACKRTDPPGATVYTADLRGRPVTVVVTGTRADVFDDATCAGPTSFVL